MDYKEFNDYELLSYIKEGNEDANNIILKKYSPLINKIAGEMIYFCKNNGLDKNDLFQEGLIGLDHAIDKYQEQENILFYTYAKTCIKRKIISVIIAANRNKNKLLNESISYDDEENLLMKMIKDSNPNPEEIVIDNEKEEQLIKKIKNNLTDLEDQVFELMISGFNYREIARILDKDQKSIDNTIQRLKSKIKKLINIEN